MGAQNIQRGTAITNSPTTSSYRTTIDTSADVELAVSLQTAAATEWAFLTMYTGYIEK
jgi:hypothetical protein